MNNKIKHCILKLKFDRPLDQKVKATDLRGAVANLYPEERLLHQHREDGKVYYGYPLIQYKIIKEECLLIGFNKGVERLTNLDLVTMKFSLREGKYSILTKEMKFYNISIGITDIFQRYHFLTPGLALNERNYEKYQRLENWTKKKAFLSDILVGNIISMSKGLDYTVPETIKVNTHHFRDVKTSLKNIPMLGFRGIFSVNFKIPNYLGLGKSVSRGFGTVVRIESQKQSRKGVKPGAFLTG